MLATRTTYTLTSIASVWREKNCYLLFAHFLCSERFVDYHYFFFHSSSFISSFLPILNPFFSLLQSRSHPENVHSFDFCLPHFGKSQILCIEFAPSVFDFLVRSCTSFRFSSSPCSVLFWFLFSVVVVEVELMVCSLSLDIIIWYPNGVFMCILRFSHFIEQFARNFSCIL